MLKRVGKKAVPSFDFASLTSCYNSSMDMDPWAIVYFRKPFSGVAVKYLHSLLKCLVNRGQMSADIVSVYGYEYGGR